MTAAEITRPNPIRFVEDIRRVCELHGLTFFFGSDGQYHIIALDDEEKQALDGPFGIFPSPLLD
jgi:hypothetical protein